MKKRSAISLAGIVLFSLVTGHAQFGPGPGAPGMGMGPGPAGPRIEGGMAQLFGENTAFSATMEMQAKAPGATGPMIMPGKFAFDNGMSRFEMDLSEAKGGNMAPQMVAQLKSMGMDKMVMIARPDKKVHYLVYPAKQAYVESPIRQEAPAAESKASDYKVESTELGRETVDGHPCVKNKVVVTDKDGKKFEATVWNATDLKKFPVKIEPTDPRGNTSTMLFKDVKLAKPDASLFEPPAGATNTPT